MFSSSQIAVLQLFLVNLWRGKQKEEKGDRFWTVLAILYSVLCEQWRRRSVLLASIDILPNERIVATVFEGANIELKTWLCFCFVFWACFFIILVMESEDFIGR